MIGALLYLAGVLGALAAIVWAVETMPRRPRPRDLTPEELEAAREVEAIAPAEAAWKRLDAPEWLRLEGEAQKRRKR